jgi:CRISPR-associated endonuclease/helicase Cas3
LAADPELFSHYFTELYQLTPTDHARKGEHTIQEDRARFNFRTVAERARVIKDDTISVIVPYGRAKKLVAQIRKTGRFNRNTLRKLQRFMVGLRQGPRSDFEKLEEVGALEPLLPGQLEIPVLSERCYDKYRGVIIQERPAEDFVQ